MLLLAIGCSSVYFEGVDGFATVGSAVALDLRVEHLLVPGEGDVGAAAAHTLLLTTEVGWCAAERARLDAVGPTNALARASLAEDPELCAAGAEVIAGAIAADTHDPDRRSYYIDHLCGGECPWDELPLGEPLSFPGASPSLAGTYRELRGGLDPDGDYWDPEACATTDAYARDTAAGVEIWEAEGLVTLDAVSPTGRVRGDFSAALHPDVGESGTVEGTFDAAPCVIEVETFVVY